MQTHHIQRSPSRRRSRRVGRGGKRGTYSGRGIKGQKARAGAKFRPAERDIIKKIPKLRGYRFKSFRPRPATVNLDTLNRIFKTGDIIDPAALLKKKIIQRRAGKTPRVKILGKGGTDKKFVFKDVSFSAGAAEKTKQH
ncbi:MAG: uL15 family ribosomal protein [Patescibacteria group bacterium]